MEWWGCGRRFSCFAQQKATNPRPAPRNPSPVSQPPFSFKKKKIHKVAAARGAHHPRQASKNLNGLRARTIFGSFCSTFHPSRGAREVATPKQGRNGLSKDFVLNQNRFGHRLNYKDMDTLVENFHERLLLLAPMEPVLTLPFSNG